MKKGSKHSKETREKLRISHLGKPASNPFKKGSIPWNKGKNIQTNTGKTHFKKGRKPTEKWYKKMRSVKGEIHPSWKGEDITYAAIHSWVIKWKGSPSICEKCGGKEFKSRQIHWANIDHKYRRVLDDYIRLCVKCHWQYDKENNAR